MGHALLEITYQWDTIGAVYKQMAPLLRDFFNATEPHAQEFPFNPDFDLYFLLERQGKAVVFTARRGDVILGFNSFIVATTFFRRDVVCAVHDILFVRPSERGVWLGYRLVKGAEAGLAQRGAKLVRYAPVSFDRLEPLLVRAKYLRKGGEYEKRIGG